MTAGSFFTAAECPCGSGRRTAVCCAPILGGAPAPTAEALMRSRYTAYVREDVRHLLASWHPSTRPADVAVGVQHWLRLEIVEVLDGAPDDEVGVVEFEATFRDVDDQVRVLQERSLFRRDGGVWRYVGPESAQVS